MSIVTVAVVLGLPFLTGHGEKRPGLAGITGRAGGLSTDSDSLVVEALSKRAGYTRPVGLLPIYGFDGIALETPVFKSWWDGRASIAAGKLHEINANTVVLGQIWKDSIRFHDTVARMHGAGVKVIIQVTDVPDWVDLRDDASGRPQPVPNTFVSGRAAHVLAEARNQGVGTFADFILIGGDATTYASQLQRQKMYQITKQYFPNTPIVRRYGMELDKAEAMLSQPHPMGGNWEDYRFGADECDIALVTVGRGVDEGRVGVRVKAALEQLNHIVSIVKSRHNEAGIIVTAQLADEKLLNNNKTAMWSSKELDQFVSAMLTSTEVDGLLLKGLGLYSYDLGNPEFEAQRTAFRDAAPRVSPTEAVSHGQAIERSPASSESLIQSE
ncbi:MAG: hypothetical protein HY075_15130 [Deltaproteobacteria bacterium]|nr:hypothetical protein [Deltaproteobacteria bacterium]